MRLAGRISAKVALRVCLCPCLRVEPKCVGGGLVGEFGAPLWPRDGVRDAGRAAWTSSAKNTGRSYACTVHA